MSNYIHTPKIISYNDIAKCGFSLSSSQHKNFKIANQNCKLVKDFLAHDLSRNDLGVEVGSANYIGQSSHYFLRTKALQSHSYLPEISSETALPIMPSSFVKMNLKAGDLIISKDSNIGEIVILDKDYPNYMLSGALYKLPIKQHKYYLLAMIKHNVFREQLDFIVPKGATIRHAKTLFLDCKIPIPNNNVDNVIKFVENLTQAIVNKQRLIKERYQTILTLIENELLNNQKDNPFSFNLPTIKEIEGVSRLDTNLYRENFKKLVFLIKNYVKGFKTIQELGFSLSRGQNLQISNIGNSIYSKKKYKNFYTLILPKFISKYGTVDSIEYLGNAKSLKTLKKGDLIFGAEGFEKGRSIVIIEEQEKVITNIHGITIQQKEHDANKAIFVKCVLDYFRNKGIINLYAVGGNGGSLAQKYWDIIPFPNFSIEKQQEITKQYHNPTDYDVEKATLDDFLALDNGFNSQAGIYELDKTAKMLTNLLDKTIENIIDNKPVDIKFNLEAALDND
ncbi:hypothetical protein L4F91_05595 [Avibacterium sp. 20-126]|uniref:hypothetical protein n=1 Tax=Avibacterium sp. 20-126 TaxID=2911524 RepID=UPI0021854D5D|nr:hypothetical protein L4F91_05595 [Avibacterium sp. 20-126]